nr:MAG TPA: hypothetical protein [Caudoviricetes sp.]
MKTKRTALFLFNERKISCVINLKYLYFYKY